MKKSDIAWVVLAVASNLYNIAGLQAAPLSNNALLGIDAGGNPDAAGQCTTGSCFGMEVSPGFWIWTIIAPGNDGGFITGKDQLSGGQEMAPSGTNTTPGDITAAWFFFGSYGTFFADNTLNTFSDTSNDGVTALNDFNVAWGGNIIPMGGGSINNYGITLDGSGGSSWNMDYTTVVSSGQFQGVNFRMLARGAVTITCDFCFVDVNDISIAANSGETATWTPDYYDPVFQEGHTCTIERAPSNGLATVNTDCSSGSYTSGDGFEGMDSFGYTVTAPDGVSGTGTVDVTVIIPPIIDTCDRFYPLVEITTIGGGQRPAVNQTLHTTFTGHFITEAGLATGGRNAVKICPGTTVDFTSTSTVGNATCIINSAATASNGTLTIGDKLICTNKPDGSDTDRFSIKSGI